MCVYVCVCLLYKFYFSSKPLPILFIGVGKEGGGPQGPGPPWFLAIAGQSRPGLASLQQELFLQYPHITSNLRLMLFVLSSLVKLFEIINIIEVIQSFHKKIKIL